MNGLAAEALVVNLVHQNQKCFPLTLDSLALIKVAKQTEIGQIYSVAQRGNQGSDGEHPWQLVILGIYQKVVNPTWKLMVTGYCLTGH